MRSKIKSVGKKVARVVAAGAGSIWTPQLQSQQELFDGMKTADPSLKGISDQHR